MPCASMAGAAWDERSGSVHLQGILTDQLLEVAEAGAARSARLASTTMMIQPCVCGCASPPPTPATVRVLLYAKSVRVRVVRVFVGCSVRVPVGEVCVFCSYGFKCRRCGTVCLF